MFNPISWSIRLLIRSSTKHQSSKWLHWICAIPFPTLPAWFSFETFSSGLSIRLLLDRISNRFLNASSPSSSAKCFLVFFLRCPCLLFFALFRFFFVFWFYFCCCCCCSSFLFSYRILGSSLNPSLDCPTEISAQIVSLTDLIPCLPDIVTWILTQQTVDFLLPSNLCSFLVMWFIVWLKSRGLIIRLSYYNKYYWLSPHRYIIEYFLSIFKWQCLEYFSRSLIDSLVILRDLLAHSSDWFKGNISEVL